MAQKITSRHSRGHQIGSIQRVSIRSDNSCLFSCFNFLLHNELVDVRQLAADVIAADPDTFNDLTLAMARDAYIEWIKQKSSWGGYIELIALSQAYKIQVVAVDIDTGRLDEYGDSASTRRIYLLYDGTHYDAVRAEDQCCPGKHVSTFEPSNTIVLNKVRRGC